MIQKYIRSTISLYIQKILHNNKPHWRKGHELIISEAKWKKRVKRQDLPVLKYSGGVNARFVL